MKWDEDVPARATFPMLPSAPLATVMERLEGGSMESVCKRAGIADRTLRDWRDGSRPTAQFDTADTVLIRLGLLWWEVFNEDTVRIPILTATRYAQRWHRKGMRREIVGQRRYGDLGPDLEMLALVAYAFTGETQGEQLEMAA